jgi:hypothetical protein
MIELISILSTYQAAPKIDDDYRSPAQLHVEHILGMMLKEFMIKPTFILYD